MSPREYRMTPGGDQPSKRPPPPPAVPLTRSQALAIDKLYADFHADVYRAARRTAWGDPGLAEDAVQRTFIKLMLNWQGHCDDAPEEVRGWLLGTVRNTVREELRARKRFSRVTAIWPETTVPSAEDEAIRSQPSQVDEIRACARDRIREVLEKAPRQLEVIERTLDGQDDRTIAKAMGTTGVNVRATRSIARGKLNRDKEMNELKKRLREASK